MCLLGLAGLVRTSRLAGVDVRNKVRISMAFMERVDKFLVLTCEFFFSIRGVTFRVSGFDVKGLCREVNGCMLSFDVES